LKPLAATRGRGRAAALAGLEGQDGAGREEAKKELSPQRHYQPQFGYRR